MIAAAFWALIGTLLAVYIPTGHPVKCAFGSLALVIAIRLIEIFRSYPQKQDIGGNGE